MIFERNLGMSLRSKLSRGNFDIGQNYYMVDSNLRTIAQGWSKADHTGPLDLWRGQNNLGTEYVYRTGDYASDEAAIQAANDAMVDFRGDILHFTPGTYVPAVVLTIDVPNARWLGPASDNMRRETVTIASTITNSLDIGAAADNFEIGFMRLVPESGETTIRIAEACNGGYAHHLYWDANDSNIAASTSTQTFVFNGSASIDEWLVANCYFIVEDAQGDVFTLDDTDDLWVDSCVFNSQAGTWATTVTQEAGCLKNVFARCWWIGVGAITNSFTGTNAGGDSAIAAYCTTDGTAQAATALETGYGTTVEFEQAENYTSGDATTEGGILVVNA